ncbi:ribonuclease J [endosymbiont 'TC1' of Trimyema compressum]|uniref:ribonuclease J n=1 Tax=endosymbiont 'TC1' of Trimyema compressum TaxID=243899 RepID=UPI0007F092B3|nr:ribonuclease J [endosymbiont 'TC1' of Trimyema compressum]AMP20688.1 ribonuclease J [endosymbiont 'TC1' of Trimyema compressum]
MGNQEKPNTVQIIPLGGVGEVGKNMTVIRYNHQMIVVDAGLIMPEDEMLGIDTVIPDISFLRENKHQLMGIVLTHGHEDHIGALPYILDELNVPTYGTRLTIGLVKRKLRERRLKRKPKLHVISPRGEFKIGPFKIEFIKVSHSIPDAVALAIHTPVGVIVHTGDFKIDLTPIDGQVTDFYKFASLGEKGVLALMSDSTNAEKKGYTKSEKIVGKNIEAIFQETKGRIIIASFASNVHRLQQIIDAAKICKRKVSVMGRSMVNMVEVSQQLGYLKIPKGLLMDIDEVLRLPKEKVCVISTGSQGEPMSALSRIAAKGHRKIEIINDDTVIISAMAIPGNEKYVSKLIDHLLKLGANVVYGKAVDIHVSGHASEEDLKLMLTLVKPKFFIPVHGEYRMQMAHRGLALDIGMKKENIFVPENGNVIALSKQKGGIVNRVHAGSVLVDGLGVGDVSNIVLRDRKILSENGIIIAVISMDKKGQIVAGPDIVSRGFVYVKQSEELLDEIKEKSYQIIEQLKKEKVKDWSTIKTRMRNELDSFVYGKIKRNPMVIPMIIEV